MAEKSLTSRQLELLNYISDIAHKEHRIPTYREMAKAMEVSAVGTIQDHIRTLVEKGYLEKEGRHIRLPENRSGPMISVPIVGEVAAGSLQDVYEVSLGTLAISPNLLERKAQPDDYFALRVKGDSMIDAGIFHGDFVVVKKNVRVKNGDIVVASHNNEATVKEIYFPPKPKGKVLLVPRNPTMEPIEIMPDEDFRVLGKVVSLQRFFA